VERTATLFPSRVLPIYSFHVRFPVVSENSIVVSQTLDTFGSFEISNLERVTNSAKDAVTMLQAPGTLSGMEFLRVTA
jgi:hypothetical protein